MIDTEKRNKRQYAWQAENKERINVLFEKGTKDRINIACGLTGQKPSEFIREAVEEKLSKSEK